MHTIRLFVLFVFATLLSCSTPTPSELAPAPSTTIPTRVSGITARKARAAGVVSKPKVPDLRTPQQLAQAACPAGRCSGVKPTLAASGYAPITPISWTVPDWYLDPANLSGCAADTNSGTAATCAGGCSGITCPSGIGPITTYREIEVHRWTTNAPILAQTTTLHFLSTETVGSEKIVLQPIQVSSSNFIVIGTPAPMGATFPAGVVTAKVRASPGQLLTVSGFPGGSVAGQLVHNTTTDSYATIDSIAGGTAVMTQPITTASLSAVSAIATGTFVEDDTWASGNLLQVLSAPIVNLEVARPSGGDSNAGFTTPAFWVQFIHIPDSSGVVGASELVIKTFAPSITLSAVTCDPFLNFDGYNTVYGANLAGVWMPGGATLVDAFVFGGASNTLLGFETGSFGSNFDGDVLMHGAFLYTTGFSFTGIGAVYIDGLFTGAHGSNALMLTSGVTIPASPGGVLWGPGSVNLEGPQTSFQLAAVGGATFANSWKVTNLLLEGAATGTSYAGGVWTDGIATTPANLDTHNGLSNPRTGVRFSHF